MAEVSFALFQASIGFGMRSMPLAKAPSSGLGMALIMFSLCGRKTRKPFFSAPCVRDGCLRRAALMASLGGWAGKVQESTAMRALKVWPASKAFRICSDSMAVSPPWQTTYSS